MQLCYDLTSSLRRLLDASTDSFWKSGWIYARVRHRVAFVYDGLFSFYLVVFASLFQLLLYLEQLRKTLAFSKGRLDILMCPAAGCIVLDTPLPHKSQKSCRILNIKPIAVCASGEVKFSVRGINLSQPTTRYSPQTFIR